MVVLLFSLIVCLTRSLAQQLPPTPPPHPILLPQANRLPDVNAQMVMKQQLQTKKDFDAANTLRQKQIGDDSVKLLILAKDLKAQMDLLGDKPVPERLQREAAVIELLAHDVQTRMTLTVGGS
ncbi:MAG TPA: hypothetical protein VK716_03300 [Terracidiphilus sp.]|nr:hypothetical protein [Terracidiphilus sp.]